MKTSRKLFLLMLLFGLLSITGVLPQNAMAQDDQQDWGSGWGSGGCTYCNQNACGCQSVEGLTLHFSCACSSIQCTRSCWYT